MSVTRELRSVDMDLKFMIICTFFVICLFKWWAFGGRLLTVHVFKFLILTVDSLLLLFKLENIFAYKFQLSALTASYSKSSMKF